MRERFRNRLPFYPPWHYKGIHFFRWFWHYSREQMWVLTGSDRFRFFDPTQEV